jgi:hypothetical protein
MSDSKEWALAQMAEVNTIYEPNERSGLTQAFGFLVWVVEWAIIWYGTAHFFFNR